MSPPSSSHAIAWPPQASNTCICVSVKVPANVSIVTSPEGGATNENQTSFEEIFSPLKPQSMLISGLPRASILLAFDGTHLQGLAMHQYSRH